MSYEYSIEGLADSYIDMAVRLAYTYLNDRSEAEDVVQEVFIKLIEKPQIFNNEEHAKAWLIRATINMCKNELKSYWHKNKMPADDIDGFDDDIDNAVYDDYKIESPVLDAVLALKEKYKSVIYLYYYEGYSTAEIARLLDKNDSTVRSLLKRAREKLKAVLADEYDFD